jgi:hypothetical protein
VGASSLHDYKEALMGGGLGLIVLTVVTVLAVVMGVVALASGGWDLLPLAFLFLVGGLAVVLGFVRWLERDVTGWERRDRQGPQSPTSS